MGPICLGVRVQDRRKKRKGDSMSMAMEQRHEEKHSKSNMKTEKGGGKGIVHVE